MVRLPEGAYKQGALYWASVRSTTQAAGGCHSSPRQDGWINGCEAAKVRLDPSDKRRHNEPDYKAGWSSV